MPASRSVVAELRAQVQKLELAGRVDEGPIVSSGCPPLDAVLPGRGFRRGALVEWLQAGVGHGAGTWALGTAIEASTDGRPVVVVDGRRQFYPPGAAAHGLNLQQTIVLRPSGWADTAWAIDQALRCGGVAAVLAWADDASQRDVRRWQLAAEQGAGLGLLIRPARARAEPCWAEVRCWVSSRFRVELLRVRGGTSGVVVQWNPDDEARALHLACG